MELNPFLLGFISPNPRATGNAYHDKYKYWDMFTAKHSGTVQVRVLSVSHGSLLDTNMYRPRDRGLVTLLFAQRHGGALLQLWVCGRPQ